MAELTAPQQVFLAREVIVDQVGSIAVGDHGINRYLDSEIEKGRTDAELLALDFTAEEIYAYRLAVIDLDRARRAMEEHAAFNHKFAQIASTYPDSMTKREQQREARLQLKDPEVMAQAVIDSGLYSRREML